MSAMSEQMAPEQETTAGGKSPEMADPRAPILPHEIDALIRKRVYASIALGMAPVPLLDLAGLYAIQLELVHALAKKYDVPFRAEIAKPLIGSLIGSVLPVSIVPIAAYLFKFIPVIGWTTSAVTVSVVGGASTYALGRVFNKHFASGGTLLGADTEKLRASFATKYEEGKEFVGKLRRKKGASAADAPEAGGAQPAA